MIYNYEPDIREEDCDWVISAIKKGIANPSVVQDTESRLEIWSGLNAAVCNSGTSALHLALLNAGIKKGDEVICPDMTFASTWNVIEYVGAKPVFVDIDPLTWCISCNDVIQKINLKTRAIISVDLFGNPCDYKNLGDICKKHGIFLIQDAAESLGSFYDKKNVFEYGDITCTSFNLNKIITSCGGGAVFSKSSEKIKKIKSYINQCKIENSYDYYDVGYNYRMGSINAALLSSQIERIDKILEKKTDIASQYKSLLSKSELSFQEVTKKSQHNNWIVAVTFDNNSTRDKVHENLRRHDIETKIPFTPGTSVKWLREKYNYKKCSNAYLVFKTGLLLPSSPSLATEDVEKICHVIRETLK